MEKNKNSVAGNFLEKKMTRKEAIQKTGITALTAASLMFLSTNTSSAASCKPGHGNGNGNGHGNGNGNGNGHGNGHGNGNGRK